MEVEVNSNSEVKQLVFDLRNEITRYYSYALQRQIKDNLNNPGFSGSRHKGKPISVTGGLMRSIKVIDDSQGQYRVVADSDYAAAVEYGSLPHMVPLTALKDWLRKKFGVSEKEVTSRAKGVQKKIALKGTEAQPFVEPAIEDNALLDEAIEKAMASIKAKYKGR